MILWEVRKNKDKVKDLEGKGNTELQQQQRTNINSLSVWKKSQHVLNKYLYVNIMNPIPLIKDQLAKFSRLHTWFEHLLSHFGDVSGQDKWKSLILLSNSILHRIHQVQQLFDKNKPISVSGGDFHTCNIYSPTQYSHISSLTHYLFLLSDSSTL